MFSKETRCLWEQMCDKGLAYVEIPCLWIVVILCLLPCWIKEDATEFGTGNGTENGYFCYPKQNGTLVFISDLEKTYNLVTDTLALLVIVLSGGIVIWSYKQERNVLEKQLKEEDLLIIRIYTDQVKRNIQHSTGAIILSYVVLRIPWIIFIEFSSAEGFSVGMRISALLYWTKCSLIFLLLAFTNKNYRKAYKDFIKMLLSCCFRFEE